MTPATRAGVKTLPSLPSRPTLFDGIPDSIPAAAPASCVSWGKGVGITVGVLVAVSIVVALLLVLRPSPTDKVVEVVTASRLQGQSQGSQGSQNTGAREVDEAEGIRILEGKEKKPAVVMVFAHWCGACKATKPAFEDAGKEAAGFFMVDNDKARGLAAKYGVKFLPTILGVRADGKLVRYPPRTARGKTQLLEFAAKLAANTATD